MQRFLGSCLSAALLLGCGNSPSAPSEPGPDGLAGPGLTASLTTTTNGDHDVAIQSFVPCANGGAGEWVSVAGTVHEVLHTTITTKGRATLVTHIQPQGVTGTGLVTGDTYNAVGVLHDVQQVMVGVQQTTVSNIRMVGLGQATNFSIHENRRTTVHADGSVTVEHLNFRLSCK